MTVLPGRRCMRSVHRRGLSNRRGRWRDRSCPRPRGPLLVPYILLQILLQIRRYRLLDLLSTISARYDLYRSVYRSASRGRHRPGNRGMPYGRPWLMAQRDSSNGALGTMITLITAGCNLKIRRKYFCTVVMPVFARCARLHY